MTSTIRVVVCRVGQPAVVADVERSYEVFRALVEGDIQIAYVGHGIELVCNEEGTINGMPFNRDVPAYARPLPEHLKNAKLLTADAGLLPPGSASQGVHRVHGNFLLCGANTRSLSAKVAAGWVRTLNEAATCFGSGR